MYVGSVGRRRFLLGPFCWRAGFFSAGVRVACVPTCLLVRTLGEVDRERVVYFPFLLNPLAGAAAWLGAGGEVGASDGMIAVAMYRVEVALCRPRNGPSGARETQWLASVEGDWLALERDGLVLRCLGRRSCLG